MARNPKNFPKQVLFSILKIAFGVFIGFGVLLILVQNAMIYHPSDYSPGVVDDFVEEGIVSLEFETNQGRQHAYWFRPASTEGAPSEELPPDTVWIAFGGNASRALVWADFLKLHRDSSIGFLLVEYPGYGDCEGSPSPTSILDNTTSAVTALSGHFQWPEQEIREKLALLGHSLGAAAALQAAEHYGVTRIVLISPFTSLKAMAVRVVTPIYAPLVRHRWDNVARLETLEGLKGANVAIVHGIDDIEIPITMSRELAERFPGMVSLEEVPNLGHNDLFYGASETILARISAFSSDSP